MAPRSNAPKLYQVAVSGVLYHDGTRVFLSPQSADVYDESHPLVRRYPNCFKEVAPLGRKVEQATAAPGEIRDVTPPKQ